MKDCIFCKIVNGELPSTKIYEDKDILAFLNINPNNYGQGLVIPKKHFQNFFETPDELVKKLFIKSKKIGTAIQKAVSASGMNVIINSNASAGQVIFHTHIHLIPRFDGDGFKHWKPKAPYKNGEDKKIAQKIISEIKN